MRGDARRDEDIPPRPALPPVLLCALGLWGSCAVVFTSAEGWGARLCVVAVVVGACVTVAAGAMIWKLHVVIGGALLGGIALGICIGGAAGALQTDVATEAEGLHGMMRFEMVEDGTRGLYGPSCFARTVLPSGRSTIVRLQFEDGRDIPRYGDMIDASVTLMDISERSASYCWRQGAVATARIDLSEPAVRHDVLGALLEVRGRGIDAVLRCDDGEGAAVLAALVCGWRGCLDEEGEYASFKATGLAHLVAVSGAHLAIVVAIVSSALKLARIRRIPSIILQSVFVMAYLVISAVPSSVVRAAIMALAGMGARPLARRPSAISALSICMIAFIASRPQESVSVSFALSALSTLGIVLFARLFSSWITRMMPWLPRMPNEALSLVLSSGITSLPVSMALFSQVSLVAPIANLVVAPLFPVVCAGGLMMVLAAAMIPQAAFLASMAVSATAMLVRLVGLLASIPFASIPVDVPFEVGIAVVAVASTALWLVWSVSWRWFLLAEASVAAFVFSTVFIVPCLAGSEIIMLDVGQGDAFVVRCGRSAILVDTGTHDRLLREALARQGIYHLDAVVITHGDDDHCGALASLRHVVGVERVLLADETFSCGSRACQDLVSDAERLVGESGVSGLREGDHVECGSFDLEVVWPERFVDEGGNADSLGLLAETDMDGDGTGEWSALFVGDAEAAQLSRMIDKGVGPVDIYKVGHHGSKDALDDASAARLAPSIALVSCGAGNRYGHPAESTLETLEGVGAQVLRTDVSGDVSCRLGSDGIQVATLR